MKEQLRKSLYSYLDKRDEFKKRAFVIDKEVPAISEAAASVARKIADSENKPVTMIMGVMPRAGTVFMGHLLSLHEEFCLHPNEMWEVPLIAPLNNILAYQRDFYSGYRHNRERMGEHDFVALFGSAFQAYLNHFVPDSKRALIKETDVRYLNYLPTLLPDVRLLLMLRDGRDLVHSTIKSWPSRKFEEVCQTWNDCAASVLDFLDRHQEDGNVMSVKFEDVLDDKEGFVREFCQQFHLSTEAYKFDEIENIGVLGSSSLKSDGKVDWKPVERPKGFRPTGHWQKWSAAEKKMFKRIAGATLIRAGYVDNNDW